MSTYRQIRRQTRHARRAGLQPIVVIDSPFPVPVGVLLARWAWRYRSEIAPATTAGATLTTAWWLHATHPNWWASPLVISGLMAFALVVFGAHIELTRQAERVYAAIASVAIGGYSRPGRCSALSPRRCRRFSAWGRCSWRFHGGRTAAAVPGFGCSEH